MRPADDYGGWRWARARVSGSYLAARAGFIAALLSLARTTSGWKAHPPTQSEAREELAASMQALPSLLNAHPVLIEQCGQKTGFLVEHLGDVAAGWPADGSKLSATFASEIDSATESALSIALPVLLNAQLDLCTTGQGVKLADVIGTEIPAAADRRRMATGLVSRAKEVAGWFDLPNDTVYATPTKLPWKIWFGALPFVAVAAGVGLFYVLAHLDNWFGSAFGPGSDWPNGLRDNTLMPVAFAVALAGAVVHVGVDHAKTLRAVDESVAVIASRQFVAWLWVHSVGLTQRIGFVALAAAGTLWLRHGAPIGTLALAGYSTDSIIGLILPKLRA